VAEISTCACHCHGGTRGKQDPGLSNKREYFVSHLCGFNGHLFEKLKVLFFCKILDDFELLLSRAGGPHKCCVSSRSGVPRTGALRLAPHIPGQASESCPSHNTQQQAANSKQQQTASSRKQQANSSSKQQQQTVNSK